MAKDIKEMKFVVKPRLNGGYIEIDNEIQFYSFGTAAKYLQKKVEEKTGEKPIMSASYLIGSWLESQKAETWQATPILSEFDFFDSHIKVVREEMISEPESIVEMPPESETIRAIKADHQLPYPDRKILIDLYERMISLSRR